MEDELNSKHKMTMKETDMLNAWLYRKHQKDVQWRRVRLGVSPSKEFSRMYSVMLRWADAIYLNDGIVHIVEAKIRPMPGAIGQLELYKKIFRTTPEFEAYQNWPIKMVLLTSMMDISVHELATDKDIAYEIFSEEDVNDVRKELFQPII